MAEARAAERDRKLLLRSPLFAEIDERSQREIAAQAVLRSFGAGEPICRLGDPGLSMMAVITGTVRISLPSIKGKEIILADLAAASISAKLRCLMENRAQQTPPR